MSERKRSYFWPVFLFFVVVLVGQHRRILAFFGYDVDRVVDPSLGAVFVFGAFFVGLFVKWAMADRRELKRSLAGRDIEGEVQQELARLGSEAYQPPIRDERDDEIERLGRRSLGLKVVEEGLEQLGELVD